MKKAGLILLGLFAFTLATGIVWQKNQIQESKTPEKMACVDITQSCGNAQFSVKFKQAPQAMKPFHLELTSNSEPFLNIHASFAMKGMEMGFNRYRLIKSASNHWQAEVTLPACVQGRSDWEMLLEIESAQGAQKFLVPFSAGHE